MYDYSQFPQQNISICDMKSFYASVECVKRNLDPLNDYLAVVGNTEREGSVVLAASPRFKQIGIKTGSRLYEIPQDLRQHAVQANMKLYLDVSVEITRLFQTYVPKEDIFVYSVDESFVDFTRTKRLYGDPYPVIEEIKGVIEKQYGLPSAWGVGDNPFLAKVGLDLYAKKTPSGIATIRFNDVPTHIWTVSPLSEIWGIGRQLERSLNRMGIFSMYDLAHTPVEALERRFGVIGRELHNHSWGIDLSDFEGVLIPFSQASKKGRGVGRGQTLFRDYNQHEIKTIILELSEEVGRVLRSRGKTARTFSLSIAYSRNVTVKGFNRAFTRELPTNITMEIYEQLLMILGQHIQDYPIRHVGIRATNLSEDHGAVQLSLFEEVKPKQYELGFAMDAIKRKYGNNAVVRAASLTPAGTAKQRSELIGGHHQ